MAHPHLQLLLLCFSLGQPLLLIFSSASLFLCLSSASTPANVGAAAALTLANVNSVWMALPPSTRRVVKGEVPKAQNKQAFSSLRIDIQGGIYRWSDVYMAGDCLVQRW